MLDLTLRYQAIPDDAEIGAVESLVRARGAHLTVARNADDAPTYALIEGADAPLAATLRSRGAATVIESPVIALAVFPSSPEALPGLLHALGGPGRPAGVTACEPLRDGVLVEWDFERTTHEIVLGLIDVELARVRAGRRTELLAPLPLRAWTRIAAAGLRAPEIGPERVLEDLLVRAHVAL
ncbi:MAG: hypothetical protein KGN02_09450 [bacterium]|nr:hypothetical protein [bacterium]